MHDDTSAPAPAGWLAAACRLMERIAMLLLGVMTVLVVGQIAGRDLFGTGMAWADELARYTGLGLVYLAIPLLLQQDKHVRVDLLLNRLPPGPRRWLDRANEGLTVLFCVLFLWGGWAFMKRAAQFSTPALGMPNWLFYLPAAIGMVTLTLVAAQRLVRAFAPHPGAR
jgi:TRAP-type C4-dicarboxylate transport system permease small subunit